MNIGQAAKVRRSPEDDPLLREHRSYRARRDPARISPRTRRDAALDVEVRRMFEDNLHVYGVCKVWR